MVGRKEDPPVPHLAPLDAGVKADLCVMLMHAVLLSGQLCNPKDKKSLAGYLCGLEVQGGELHM